MKNETPFLSICIPSYNYEQYLIRGLDSIKRQAFHDYEIVICDDCSQDHSCNMIRSYMRENPHMNIRLLINEEKKGILYTKQRLLDNSTGKYVMFCDADDWMAPNCLEVLCQKAIEEDADRVIGEIYDINEKGVILQIQDHGRHPSKWLSTLHHGSIYRRSILTENNVKFLASPDDAYLILKFNQYAQKIIFIDEPLYYWFVHGDSAGRTVKKQATVQEYTQYFLNVLNYVSETMEYMRHRNFREPEEASDDLSQIELLLIKLYYARIYGLGAYSLKNKFRMYSAIHRQIKERYPLYLQNKYLRFREKACPLRNYAKRIVRFSALLEKCHIFWGGLIAYHIAGKFIYFDQ